MVVVSFQDQYYRIVVTSRSVILPVQYCDAVCSSIVGLGRYKEKKERKRRQQPYQNMEHNLCVRDLTCSKIT